MTSRRQNVVRHDDFLDVIIEIEKKFVAFRVIDDIQFDFQRFEINDEFEYESLFLFDVVMFLINVKSTIFEIFDLSMQIVLKIRSRHQFVVLTLIDYFVNVS